MDIIVSNMDSTPIYEQITRQIKAKILGGELQPGEALPSMRLLAKELRISVITTKRAYEELEREGLITSQTGRGSFVAPVSAASHGGRPPDGRCAGGKTGRTVCGRVRRAGTDTV